MSTPPPTDGPLSFAAFQRLIRDRYHATDSARGVPGTFMWLIEEVGELATALQDNAPGKSPTQEQRDNLEEEFADVLAWLTTIANIAGVDLESALRKYTVGSGPEGVKD
ncbi:MAG: MazG nucleotide pyrophosphohydrolase domain-containing protein [Phycisphaerales bacterium]